MKNKSADKMSHFHHAIIVVKQIHDNNNVYNMYKKLKDYTPELNLNLKTVFSYFLVKNIQRSIACGY